MYKCFLAIAITLSCLLFYRMEARAQTKALLLFGGEDHKVFLGCLNCSFAVSSSVCNVFAPHGSIVGKESIWNIVGAYGSIISKYSPWNVIANEPPIVVDADGKSYGYFTVNVAHRDRTKLPWVMSLLDYANDNEDSDKTRTRLCGD